MMPKKNKGSALIVVIMVMVIMTILGAAILNISLSQTMQASNEDKRIQAHYLARAGAEAALSAWKDADNDNKPSGVSNPVYLNSSNVFVYTQTANMIGQFDVNVSPVEQGKDTVITSKGTVGNVTQTVKVTIKEVTISVPIPPLDPVYGKDLNWYSFNSGQINTNDNIMSGKGKNVIVEAKNSLKIPNKNSPAANFEADQMQFLSQIQILHNSIILSGKLIDFNVPVDFSNNGNGNGALVLKVLDNGFEPNGSHFIGRVGVIFFQNIGYYFKNVDGGIILKNSSDIQDQVTANNLEKIIDPKSSFLSTDTKTIISYSIIWS